MCFPLFYKQVDIDTVWNEQHTAAASQVAAGCVIDLALKVAQRQLKVRWITVRWMDVCMFVCLIVSGYVFHT